MNFGGNYQKLGQAFTSLEPTRDQIYNIGINPIVIALYSKCAGVI